MLNTLGDFRAYGPRSVDSISSSMMVEAVKEKEKRRRNGMSEGYQRSFDDDANCARETRLLLRALLPFYVVLDYGSVARVQYTAYTFRLFRLSAAYPGKGMEVKKKYKESSTDRPSTLNIQVPDLGQQDTEHTTG
ncbi:hypothetical protein J3R30DRAFT_3739350 [Lentinula aciculospora]|uniref:Uncharacterized protein n=1 Tax=Lentinula aciculospora TaxID=153920 RepID=A0A9W8ZY03_9AGAR|nr:hypothetical protein J3R30DRAFT_3739350 [Lentinula aciculospora]